MRFFLIYSLFFICEAFAESNEDDFKNIFKINEIVSSLNSTRDLSCRENLNIGNNRQSIKHETNDPNDEELLVSTLSEEELTYIFTILKNDKENFFNNIRGGCEARAHRMVQVLDGLGVQSIKVFIQGRADNTLRVKTDKEPAGFVEWPFHVAPLVKLKTGKKIIKRVKTGFFSSKEVEVDEIVDMVLDPGIFDKPVPLSQWIKIQTEFNKTIKRDLFFTQKYNYFPQDKYEKLKSYQDMDNDRMQSRIDRNKTELEERQSK